MMSGISSSTPYPRAHIPPRPPRTVRHRNLCLNGDFRATVLRRKRGGFIVWQKAKSTVVLSLLLALGVALGGCSGGTAETGAKGDSPVVKASEAKTPGTTAESPSALAPMVKVDGETYYDLGYVNSAMTCGTADGKIESSVPPTQKPQQSNESNFGVGAQYQRWEPGYLSVKRGEKWHIFQNLAMDISTIPPGVANFSGKVVEVAPQRLLVEVTQVPPEFARIFGMRPEETSTSKPQVKPISLPVDKLDYTANGKTMTTKGLLGKSVTVWFDGTLTKAEPEMSYPAQLGEVYKIAVQ